MSEPLSLDRYEVRKVGRCSPTSHAHIIADSDAKKTLCGLTLSRIPDSQYGITLARWVQAHIDGHDPEWCEQCLYRWAQP